VRRLLASAVLLLALLAPAAARAKDPGRWHLTARHTIPVRYYQGMATDGKGHLFFDGVYQGLYRTDLHLRQQAGTDDVIDPATALREGYNHIGDISYSAREGGRVLLPLECYNPAGRPANFCGTGSIGVADPVTLDWRYSVKLDPRDIAKAMWVEPQPDGKLVWTQAGDDLIAYRGSDVTQAHASPAAKPIRPVRRLKGAVPEGGITGAVFYHGRLFVAGGDEPQLRIASIDLRTGRSRLEVQRTIHGESEGLAIVDALGGGLHWMIQPVAQQPPPTYAKSSILSFVPSEPLRVRVDPARAPAGVRTRFAVRVTQPLLGRRRPVKGATVRLGTARARTNAKGRAVLTVRLPHAGTYRLRAAWRGDRGSVRVRAGAAPHRGSGLG
jgi:hypothetical protein